MLQHGAYKRKFTSDFPHSCFFCLPVYSYLQKKKSKRRISVDLSDQGVDLASKDQYIQEIHAEMLI